MNWTRDARAALAGLFPRQADKHVRRLQSAIVLELFKHERDSGDRRVNDETWKYLEIKRKNKS